MTGCGPDLPRASRVLVRVGDGAVSLVVTGNMDSRTAAGFRAELLELGEICTGALTVDLSACSEVSTAVLAALELAQDTARCGRYRLRVIAGHPEITLALSRAGITCAT
jgi:anti-anti-sigma regulatory factor